MPNQGATNDDLEVYAAELRTALANANGDKARIRAFSDGAAAALEGRGATAAKAGPVTKADGQAPPGAVSAARPSLRDRIKNLWKGKKP